MCSYVCGCTDDISEPSSGYVQHGGGNSIVVCYIHGMRDHRVGRALPGMEQPLIRGCSRQPVRTSCHRFRHLSCPGIPRTQHLNEKSPACKER